MTPKVPISDAAEANLEQVADCVVLEWFALMPVRWAEMMIAWQNAWINGPDERMWLPWLAPLPPWNPGPASR